MELFGFSTENELNCFQLLTSVSGVGPKAALSILSAATPESLAMSIITGGRKGPDGGPGHREKNRPAHHPGAERQAGQGTDRPWRRELWRHRRHGNPGEQVQRGRCALAVLGYSQSEIAVALKGIDVDGLALEEIIKQALKRMVKN